MKKRYIIFALWALSCSKENQTATQETQVIKNTPVEINPTQRVPLHTIGRVTSSSTREYRIPTTGVIDSIYVTNGDTIQPGDTILSLNHENILTQERLQLVKLSAARKDKIRVNALYKKGAKTALENEKAEQRYQLESAKLNTLRAEKELRYLRAVDHGVVTSLNKLRKSFVEAGDTVVVVEGLEQQITCAIPAAWRGIDFNNSKVTADFPGDTLITMDNIQIEFSNKESAQISSPVTLNGKNGTKCAVTIHAEIENTYLISNFASNELTPGDLVTIKFTDGENSVCRIISSGSNSLYVQGTISHNGKTIESISLF